MCFSRSMDEAERGEPRKAAREPELDGDREQRRDPSGYPTPRGNQERDERELERSGERLASVLGH